MVRSQPVSNPPANPVTTSATSTQPRTDDTRCTASPFSNDSTTQSVSAPGRRFQPLRAVLRSLTDRVICSGFQTRRPATQPVMKVAREPDTMERTPSSATSERRLGARPPIPPSKMASEPKFAKPQSA